MSQVNAADLITCSRCGSEMKKDSRYCMKCGNLNYSHEDNQFMKQYAIKDIKQGSYIAGLEQAKSLGVDVPKDVSNHEFRTCFIVNVILFGIPLLLVLVAFILSLNGDSVNIGGIIGSLVAIGICFIESYGYQRMLIKAGQPWWSIYIPIYGQYTLFEAGMGNGLLCLLMFVPILNFIVSIMCTFALANKFSKSGWLMLFFPFVMIPLIGFDSNTAYIFTNKKELSARTLTLDPTKKTQSEKEYGRKKIVITILIVAVFGLAIWLGRDILVDLYEFFLKQLEFFK